MKTPVESLQAKMPISRVIQHSGLPINTSVWWRRAGDSVDSRVPEYLGTSTLGPSASTLGCSLELSVPLSSGVAGHEAGQDRS